MRFGALITSLSRVYGKSVCIFLSAIFTIYNDHKSSFTILKLNAHLPIQDIEYLNTPVLSLALFIVVSNKYYLVIILTF